MALSVAEVGDFTREYGTYIGDLKVSHQPCKKVNEKLQCVKIDLQSGQIISFEFF